MSFIIVKKKEKAAQPELVTRIAWAEDLARMGNVSAKKDTKENTVRRNPA